MHCTYYNYNHFIIDCNQNYQRNRASKCGADLNFEVDLGVNGAIRTIVTKWDPILFRLWIVFIHNIIFLNTHHMPLKF